MATYTEIREAIERSRSHNEIVHVQVPSKHSDRDADAAMLQGTLGAEYDGEIDSAWENDGSLDIWGYDEDAPAGEMDWRLKVTFA